MNKICKDCNIEKPTTEFYKDAQTPGGYRHNCKACKNKKTVKWRSENRERYNAIAREHHKKHYQKFRLQRYGITPEQHSKMLELQEKVCSLCGAAPNGKRPLAVDHDHTTKVVRELLCYGCNREMATVDNDEKLAKLIAYRDKYRLKAKKEAA